MRFCVPWLCVVAIVGCSSLSDLSGGRVPAADDRADGPVAVTKGTDGGSDASVIVDVDAARADGESEAGAAPFDCALHPAALVCENFDTDPFAMGFTERVTVPGTLSPSTTRSASAPRSLLATLEKRTTGVPVANAFKPLGTSWSSLRIAWDMLVVSDGDQAAVDVGGVYAAGAPFHSLTIRYRQNPTPQLELFEFGEATAGHGVIIKFSPLSGSLPPGVFSRIELRVQRTSTTSSASVLLNGVAVLSDQSLSAHDYVNPLNVMAGISTSDGAGEAIQVFVDNLLIEPL